MNEQFERLIVRVESLMARIESVLPQPLTAPDWRASVAFRYRKRSSGHGALEPVRHCYRIAPTASPSNGTDRERSNPEHFAHYSLRS